MLSKNELHDLILSTQLQLELSAGVIEKDYYVTQIIHALAGIENENFQLVFGGGTCLAKAHRLVKRMSEDVDFKIVFKGTEVSSKTLFLKMLKEFRSQITESISFPGITITNNAVRNEGKYMRIELAYPVLFTSNDILRPHLLLEFTESKTRLNTQALGIKSIIEDTITQVNFSPASLINCISVNETAIEKWVALTRRISAIERGYDPDDATLIRHLYDLRAIKQADIINENFFGLAKTIIDQDAQQFKNKHPEYAKNPIGEIQQSISLLKSKSKWKTRYQDFIATMVYEKQDSPDFDTALASAEELSKQTLLTLR